MQKLKNLFTKIAYDPKTLQHKNMLGGMATLEECNTDKILELFKANPINNVELSSGLYKDIEFWDNVYPKINKCVLSGGSYFLRKLFEAPIVDIELLEQRKNILRKIDLDNEELKLLKDIEKNVLWTFQDLEENVGDLYDLVYFKFFFL